VEQNRRKEIGLRLTARRILYVQYTDPAAYPPVEHSSRLLAQRGWEVLIFGSGSFGNLKIRLSRHPRIRVKKLGFVHGGWWQKAHYMVFFVVLLYWTWQWRPLWIYASDPLACPVVWILQKIFKLNVVYHEHDTPNLDEEHSWFYTKVLTYRIKLASDANLCILPQHERLSQLIETTGRTKSTFCVWNCPRLDEIGDVTSGQNDHLIVYYHGSITSDRLPPQVVIAASRFKGAVRLLIAGYEVPGSVGYMRELITLAEKYGSSEIIEYVGTMPRYDLFRMAARAHVGLSLMPRQSKDVNMRCMVGASNKSFDYMACGVPLLVTNLPDWVATFVHPGYARACDPHDPDSIEVELRWYLDHPNERREMGWRSREKIRQNWNYENMFAGPLASIENS
jgi:glycosyltransferase involved in cell wall biosynthesis